MIDDPYIDLAFPISEGKVPIDHGYLVYASLAARLPVLHEAPWLAVHPLSGRRIDDRHLLLTRDSTLTLRVPAARIPDALQLAGAELRLETVLFQLGAPTTRLLQPSSDLFALQVLVRLTDPPKASDGRLDLIAFRNAVRAEAQRQLDQLSVKASIELLGQRRLRIKGQCLIAFSVALSDVSKDDSLKIQTHGLGGKRRMGCGVFRRHRP